MATWLSIDWDFFIFEDPNWDWGHRESILHRDGMLWNINAVNALAAGLDLRKEMDPEKHAPGAKAFWGLLRRAGFTFPSGLPIVVADSHLFGAHFFIPMEDGKPHDLLHFDAHHDLGYTDHAKMTRAFRNQRVECGSWLYHVMRRNRKLTTRPVYPIWKGLREMDASKGLGWMEMPSLAQRVRSLTPSSPSEHATVWSEEALMSYGFHGTRDSRRVEGIYIARSGSWAPPWTDAAFIAFVRELEEFTGTRVRTPFKADEKCDPLAPREFNWDAVEKEAETLRKFRDESITGLLKLKQEKDRREAAP